jgi:hypothetical protein
MEGTDSSGELDDRKHAIGVTQQPPALVDGIRAKSWMTAVLPDAAQATRQQDH